MSVRRIAFPIFLASTFFFFTAPALAQTTKSLTVQNLQQAYDVEANIGDRYNAFANQADKEGYHQIASLFRAAARSAQVHAGNHAALLNRLRAQAKSEIKTYTVKTTPENLAESIKTATANSTTMYPDFANQAKTDGNEQAVRSFTLAGRATGDQAKLFQHVLKHLEQQKGRPATVFYVCPTCGYILSKTAPSQKCPSCGEPESDFQKVK